MIIQGSNNPLVIQFDADIENIPTLVVTLWKDKAGYASELVKQWMTEDMSIDGDTAVCELTEDDTRKYPSSYLMLEAKGLDENGNTIFWDEYKLDIKTRRDKVIMLTRADSGTEDEDDQEG